MIRSDTESDLSMHEQLLLLALHDEKGTVQASLFLYAIAGAMLAELLHRGQLRIETQTKRSILIVGDVSPTGDPLLDECVEHVSRVQRAHTLPTWIGRIAATKNLKSRIAERLCDRGILFRSEDRVLWVFPRVIYPTANETTEQRLVAALRQAIEQDGQVDARTAIVLSLAHSAGMLSQVFDRSLLKARRARIEALKESNAVSGATKGAIDAAQAAAAAVATMAAVTTAASD